MPFELLIDFIVFCFAAVYGFHVQCMSKDKINFVIGAQISKPVPTENAFNPDNDVFNKRKGQLEKEFGIGFDVFMGDDRSLVVQDTNVHFPGMQIDTAIVFVLLIVEFHSLPPFAFGN
jgi:hypothetical protein